MSKDQFEFYTLLKRHATEWNRAYNKCIAFKHNWNIAVGCLTHAQCFTDYAEYISNLGTADWKRWRYMNERKYGILWFYLTDLYGVPQVKLMPVIRTSNQPSAPAQLALF